MKVGHPSSPVAGSRTLIGNEIAVLPILERSAYSGKKRVSEVRRPHFGPPSGDSA